MKTQFAIHGVGGDIAIPEGVTLIIQSGEETLGEIQPANGGLRIVSPHIRDKMGSIYVEPQDPPALNVVLQRTEIPPMTKWEHSTREMLMDETVERAVRHVYATIFDDNGFTSAETAFAWAAVIAKLTQSQLLDLQRQMLVERLTKEKR